MWWICAPGSENKDDDSEQGNSGWFIEDILDGGCLVMKRSWGSLIRDRHTLPVSGCDITL